MSELAREGAPLDLLFANREGLVGNVVAEHSGYEMLEFLILREVRRGFSRTTTLDFQRTDFGLFRCVVDTVPWEVVMKGKGVQEGGAFFKEEVFQVQKQAVPVCRKTSQWGRRPAWLNRELWLRHS